LSSNWLRLQGCLPFALSGMPSKFKCDRLFAAITALGSAEPVDNGEERGNLAYGSVSFIKKKKKSKALKFHAQWKEILLIQAPQSLFLAFFSFPNQHSPSVR